jgi:fatty acid desaturase
MAFVATPAKGPERGPAQSPNRGWLLAHSAWDAVPVLCGLLHLGYLVGWFLLFSRLPWWANVLAGLGYAVSISWNINGISHNFLHNPYFRWAPLNRLFSIVESLACGFSQTFYTCVHMKHHVGNSDLPDEKGETVDWLSIYRHGDSGLPENVWSYTFLSFFRDDPKAIHQEIKKRNPADARFGIVEIALFIAFFTAMGVANWHFILALLPAWYFGHCLSYLNGYFEHYAGNPDKPIAWGVSTYDRLYNLTWFNNGYHAEHHYRPKTHWTKMPELHRQIAQQQHDAGTRVIRPPHALGFFDKDLPSMADLAAAVEVKPAAPAETPPPPAASAAATPAERP